MIRCVHGNASIFHEFNIRVFISHRGVYVWSLLNFLRGKKDTSTRMLIYLKMIATTESTQSQRFIFCCPPDIDWIIWW